MQQTEQVTETAGVDCSRCTVCITSTERLFWARKCPSDSKHFLYDWYLKEWRTPTDETNIEVNECWNFCLFSPLNHGLRTPSPCCSNHLLSVYMCVCVYKCKRVSRSVLVSRCDYPNISSNFKSRDFSAPGSIKEVSQKSCFCININFGHLGNKWQ